MNYVIVTKEWCESKGIAVPESARKSLDGTKVLFHYEFVSPVLNEGEELTKYAHNSAELNSILSSSEWYVADGEQQA